MNEEKRRQEKLKSDAERKLLRITNITEGEREEDRWEAREGAAKTPCGSIKTRTGKRMKYTCVEIKETKGY